MRAYRRSKRIPDCSIGRRRIRWKSDTSLGEPDSVWYLPEAMQQMPVCVTSVSHRGILPLLRLRH